PSQFVFLDELPLTSNGKVNRKALPAPQFAALPERRPQPPRTEVEAQLCEMWKELLGAAQIGIQDNFFEQGGDSLLATRLVSRVRARLGIELNLRTLFERPTIEELARAIETVQWAA